MPYNTPSRCLLENSLEKLMTVFNLTIVGMAKIPTNEDGFFLQQNMIT
jgi:hypothetical protein